MSFFSPAHYCPTFRRIALAALGAGVLVAVTPLAASAHVTARADSTTTGSFSQISLRVPNESPTAGTVKLQVQLPQDKPFAFLSVKPVPGWTIKVEQATLPEPIEVEGTTITKAARTITWTAAKGTQIRPGEYQEFAVSAGPLPAAGELLLPATQTYSDGTIVQWDEPTPASGEEPEHPAPAIDILPATTDTNGSAPTSASSPAAQPPTSAAASGSDTTARLLAGAALLVALGSVVLSARGARRGAS
jgi:uncharacterized protein YcnI